MTVTINLPAEVEASLVAQAQAQGLEIPQLVENILREQVKPVRRQKELTPAGKAKAWIEGAKRFPNTPPLSDEAISRENLYGDRG
jgi:hypothetical protein